VVQEICAARRPGVCGLGMDSYPPEFVSKLSALAHDVGLWVESQATAKAEEADMRLEQAEECCKQMADVGTFDEKTCQQIQDVAVTAAALTLGRVFQLRDLDEFQQDFKAACEPPPDVVSPEVWRRTQDFFLASARLSCAEVRGDIPGVEREQQIYNRHARQLASLRRVSFMTAPLERKQSFSDEWASRVIPGMVVMLSTTVDHNDKKEPRTPYSSAVVGRCTELMLEALSELPSRSWMEMLWAMRRLASERHRQAQIPVLSCSRRVDLNTMVSPRHPHANGRRRALLVGINYAGQQGLQIPVGHKDVKAMQQYLDAQGFVGDDVQVLMDDNEHTVPQRRILKRA